jgi:UDP-N-acetyl-D-galactosamine dehydrogenase
VVDVHDAFADPGEANSIFGVSLLSSLDDASGYDCVVGAVPHQPYVEFNITRFENLLTDNGLIADVKGMWRTLEFPDQIGRWQL